MGEAGIEQRTCVRFEIPGATVSYRTKKLIDLTKKYGEEFCPVADVSRGGLRFLSKNCPHINSEISLKVAIPGEKTPLNLIGRVRWVGKFASGEYKCQIGVQFYPYGEKKNQNYPGALVKIIALEQKFAPSEEEE
jgi:hypothetical protein